MTELSPPVPDIIRSAYATLVVTDLAQARRFWVDLLGFVVTHEDSRSLYMRGFDELTQFTESQYGYLFRQQLDHVPS